MRFLIAGAGAIGAYIGARLAHSGPGRHVVVCARRCIFARCRNAEVRVISPDGDFEVRPPVIGDLKEAGDVDVIILGVKAHGLTQLAPQIKPLSVRKQRRKHTKNGFRGGTSRNFAWNASIRAV